MKDSKVLNLIDNNFQRKKSIRKNKSSALAPATIHYRDTELSPFSGGGIDSGIPHTALYFLLNDEL